MGEITFFIIFSIPALFGLAELLHYLKVYIISPKVASTKYLIVFLGDNSPCKQLALAGEEYFWRGRKYAYNIIAVDCGISDEDYLVCHSFCNKNNFIFCSYNELGEYLEVISGKL